LGLLPGQRREGLRRGKPLRMLHDASLCQSLFEGWFAQLCAAAGMPEVTLHRLRHSVATVLVGRGQILQAQYRLGHADAYTTLRIYSHAQPLHDLDAADTLDELYRT